MFTQQKLFFQFTKVIALVILFCFTFSYQAKGGKAVKAKAMDVAEITAQIEYYQNTLCKNIKENLFVHLKKEFKKPEPGFYDMALLLGRYSIITTPQGDRIMGKDSIVRFWRKEKERGVMDVDFTLKYYYVSILADPIEKLDPQQTIDAVGYAIIDYRLMYTKGGKILTNQTGTLTISFRHSRICVWCS